MTKTTLHCVDLQHLNTKSVDAVIVVGRKARLLGEPVVNLLPDAVHGVWQRMVDALSPGDSGEGASTWIADGDGQHRVIALALPDVCSRHNSRAHPHPIRALLKQHLPKDGRIALVLALEHADDALASVCAVARSMPTYSRKTRSATDTTQERKERHVSVACISAEGSVSAFAWERASQAAAAVRRAGEWVDMPTCELHTETFVDAALAIAQRLGVQSTVIRGDALREQGLGGLWSVGRAAVHGPALVVLRYMPPQAKGNVVWVGKGLVYDTGGLSLKGTENMPGMKGDMGGAAAVLAAFEIAVQQQVPYQLSAVLCIAENAIGPEATRPDDIITLLSGKTVEVNNTDAEGRLVLSDGLAYAAAHLHPDVMVDLATLTGAQATTTGKRHAAIVSNDERWEQAAVHAGRLSGDLVHPILYCPEFFRAEFKSDVADLKNSVKDRANAQSSCAAQFIAENLGGYKGPWLHVDIAAPASTDERGTGFGVALLMTLFAEGVCPL